MILNNIGKEKDIRNKRIITSSPGLSIFIKQSIAANPDPKQAPNFPFSKAAKLFSKAFLVGLLVLEYA